MKKCYGISLFKLAHSLKKSMACVNIAQWQFSISSFEMLIICLNNARLYLSILAFTHCHVVHSFVLLIAHFHSIPHVLISSKCWRGTNQVSSLGYSQGFVVISHILSNILEINVYSIIDSKVFGVKIGVNFPLAIVK